MTITLLKLICPTILFISVFFPFYRGFKRVLWWKSVLLGWGFFVTGCLFREFFTPWIAGMSMGEHAKAQVKCINSYLLFGIALGWFFPLIFHWLGVHGAKTIDKKRAKKTC